MGVDGNKLSELLQNEKVVEQLANAETKEKMQEIFKANGVEFSIPEVEFFIKQMNKAVNDEDLDTCLDEEALDSVTGGGGVSAAWIIEKTVKGAIAVTKYAWKFGKWLSEHT